MYYFLRRTAKKTVLGAIRAWDACTQGDSLPATHGNRLERWGMSAGPDGHLLLDGIDTVAMSSQYGTPLYLVSRKKLEEDYQAFRSAFSSWYPNVEVCVSYKTNPVPAVLGILREAGGSAEVISHFELWLALKVGVPPERIVFNGPCKTSESLELAVSSRVKLINVDNMSEIDAIDRIAGSSGIQFPVGVRLITSVGWDSQFGLSIRSGAAWEAFRAIREKRNLDPVGIHLHLGTGIKDIDLYLQAIREALDFAKEIRMKMGVVLRYFDIGGGFGVPTVRKVSPLDEKLLTNGYPARPTRGAPGPEIGEYGRQIGKLLKERFPEGPEGMPGLLLEPGRAVMSRAQSLLVRVVAVKEGKNGVKTVIVNGGKNVTMPLAYEHHEAFSSAKMGLPPDAIHYNIYGPLCHPGDVLFRLKRFPKVEVGDLFAIMDAGAYFVPNQMNFSNPRPGVVLVENGVHRMVRTPETFDHIVALDTP